MVKKLDADALYDLTGWRRASDQARWLEERGIPHQVDGRRVIVYPHHVNAWVEGRPMASHAGPNWAAVR